MKKLLANKEQTVAMFIPLFALIQFEDFEIKDRLISVGSSGHTATALGEAHARWNLEIKSNREQTEDDVWNFEQVRKVYVQLTFKKLNDTVIERTPQSSC